jgi:hypothetical protein
VNKQQAEKTLEIMGTKNHPGRQESISTLSAKMAEQRLATQLRLGEEQYRIQSASVRQVMRELMAEFGLPVTPVAITLVKATAETGGDTGLVLAALADELVSELEAPIV